MRKNEVEKFIACFVFLPLSVDTFHDNQFQVIIHPRKYENNTLFQELDLLVRAFLKIV